MRERLQRFGGPTFRIQAGNGALELREGLWMIQIIGVQDQPERALGPQQAMDLDHPKTFAQFQRTVTRLDAEGWTPKPLEAFAQ
ncbi:MAG: hypothetical protein AAFW64_09245, partial [Pseudomonadota bacterium]